MAKRHTYEGTPLTPENVRPALRIRERHPAGQDRFIVHVVPGSHIDCNGIASGRATSVKWSKIGRYNIVDNGSVAKTDD